MEVNTGISSKAAANSAQTAKVAAGTDAAKRTSQVSSASVEQKASPKVVEFEPSDIDKAVEELQAYVDSLARELSFHRDESIGRSIITVRDANTNQLVRQIPAEEVVQIARQIKEDLDAKRAGMLLKGEA